MPDNENLSFHGKSAGILLYRFDNNLTEVLLVHPGGPFGQRKIWDHGPFQKESLNPKKIHWLQQKRIEEETE